MQRLLRRLLNLQLGEGRKLIVLYGLGLVVATSLVWGKAIGRGLFLKRVGIEWLPLMFIFDGLLAFPVTVVYTSLVDRVSNARLMAAIFGGVGVVLLGGWGLLLLDEWGVTIPYVIAVYALFYVAERVLRALVAIHTWTLFNDYLDIRAAKRLFPILGSASRVAGTLGGAAVIGMANWLPAQHLILAWVAVLVVGIWLSSSIPRWLAADRQEPAPRSFDKVPTGHARGRSTRPAQSSVAAYWENLRGGFRFVSASSFLKVLAVGGLAMTVLIGLTDYQSQSVFDQSYGTAEELIGFYGKLDSLINLVALPVQMFLISRLVSWLGVAQVNLFYPLGSLVIYGALSIWPSLSTAMAGQFGTDTFRSSVQSPVDNMLYNAIPPAVKGRARAFIRGLLLPLATVGYGLVLLFIPEKGPLPYWVMGIGGFAALVQVAAAFLVRRRYTQALVTMLEEEDFSAYRLVGSELGAPDPATFQHLLRRLRASVDDAGDPGYALFLARIVAEVGGREAGARLVEVAETSGPPLRAGILEMLVEMDIADDTALALSRQLLAAEDSRLRRAALAVLERLMGADSPDLWPLAVPLLDDPDPDTRLPAIHLLVRCGDFFYLADAVRSLNELLGNQTDPAYRIAGLRALETVGDARMVRNLTRYLDDPDDRVRLQTALTIEALADPEAPEWAVSLIRETMARESADPVESVRLSALRTLGKMGTRKGRGDEAALEQLMAALADASELVREQAILQLIALGRAATPALEATLDDQQTPERTQQAAAVALGRVARDRIVSAGDAQRHIRRIQDLFEDILQRIYGDMRLIAALTELPVRPSPPKPAAGHRREDPAERSTAPRPALRPSAKRGLSGLDKLLGGSGRRRGFPAAPAPETPSPAEPSAELTTGLLHDGLRQRNERRLETAFRLLGATLREPPSTVEVIAHTLRHSPARSPTRASALEALESLTSPRLVRLVGQLTPLDQADVAELIATGQQEWDFEPLSSRQALEVVLTDQDRWLGAIGIVLAGQTTLIDAASLQQTWLPTWQADPDAAVQEAARYTARRLEMETEMEDTREMAGPIALSAVERAIFLKQIPFFAGMTVDQLHILADIAEEQYYDEGETIFAEGDPGETLCVIVSGRVGIERSPKRGRVQRLETLEARQHFGEQTIFDGAPHENRAVAVNPVHLLAILREPLLTLIRRSPDLSLSLVTVLSQRLRDADAKLAARTRVKPDQVMRLYDKLTEEE